jgi:arginine exporter protein ArgO
VAIAAVLGSILTIVSTLAVAAFLPHRESLAAVMLLTGAIATVVLSLVAGRDVGRAQARERLRVEAAVRKLEADYEAKRVRVEAEAEVVEEEPSRKIDRRT